MKLYGELEKYEAQDDGTIVVTGYASSEDVDADGERVSKEAMAAALPEYMKFANIREMHQPKAAGIALKAEVQADGRTLLEALIVDAGAVRKVQRGVYKGFSIGGKVTARDAEDAALITGVRLSEISLVDRPANPKAVFAMWKIDGGDDVEDLSVQYVDETVENMEKFEKILVLEADNQLLRGKIEQLESALAATAQPPKALLKVVGKAEDYAVDDEPDIAADDVMGQLRKALRSPSFLVW